MSRIRSRLAWSIMSNLHRDLDWCTGNMLRDHSQVILEVCMDPVGCKLRSSLDFQILTLQLDGGLPEPHVMASLAKSLTEQIIDGVGGWGGG